MAGRGRGRPVATFRRGTSVCVLHWHARVNRRSSVLSSCNHIDTRYHLEVMAMECFVDRVEPARCAEKSDADLVAEMRQPGSDALGTLFRRYLRLVRRVAAGILRDEAEAEDVTQEVFLEIYRKAHLYDPARGAVRVWLLQYAYRRSLQRKHALRRSAAYCGEPLDDVDRSPSPLVSSSRQLTRQECRWVIRRGLAVLTSQQRATLELACLEEA